MLHIVDLMGDVPYTGIIGQHSPMITRHACMRHIQVFMGIVVMSLNRSGDIKMHPMNEIWNAWQRSKFVMLKF